MTTRVCNCLPQVLLLAGASAVTSSVGAQDSTARAASRPPACTFDTAKFRQPVSLVVYLAVPHTPVLSPDARAEALGYLSVLQDHFERPDHLTLTDAAVVVPWEGKAARDSFGLGLGGPLLLPLTADGRLRDTAIASRALIPEVNTAVIAAVRATDSAGPPPLAHWVREFRGTLAALQIGDGQQLPDEAVALLRARVSVLKPDTPVSPKNQPKPRVPSAWIGREVVVRIDLRYIVAPTGRAELNSIEVLRVATHHPDVDAPYLAAFAQSAINTIRESTFVPARAGGCPLRQWVQQSIIFQLGR